MEAELSVPEGWMLEKDEQGKEFFVSPDGTSVASRRLEYWDSHNRAYQFVKIIHFLKFDF